MTVGCCAQTLACLPWAISFLISEQQLFKSVTYVVSLNKPCSVDLTDVTGDNDVPTERVGGRRVEKVCSSRSLSIVA
jgi:hypothetical protein